MEYLHLLVFILLHLFGLPRLTNAAVDQKSGNYFLTHCGAGPGSKAARLQKEIPQYQTYLRLVVADLQSVKAGQTSNAYRAFFKSDKNAARVERVFQNLIDGALVRLPVRGRSSNVVHATPPEVICLDENHPEWEQQTPCPGQNVAAMIPMTETAILCPLYFDLKIKPRGRDCPRVRHNTFSPDNHRISYNRFGSFVHEFAHAYIPNWDMEQEVMNPGAAVGLSAEKSRKNAQNYALYASMVVANCTQFVIPSSINDEF